MTSKIFGVEKAIIIARKYNKSGKKIVLAGGCFDILHIGHIKFLESSKKLGEYLFVLLEPDEKVRKLKGKDRPIFSQTDRAHALASLADVDIIILLSYLPDNSDYQKIVSDIKPDVIAVTENDPFILIKKKQIEETGGKLQIIPYVKSLSSSKLAEILSREKI